MFIFLSITSILLAAGCSSNEKKMNQESNLPITKTSTTQTNSDINQDISQDAIQLVLAMPEVTNANAINTDEELLLVFDIKHIKQFYLKKIEQKVKKKLQERFPKYTITVSSDLKISLETKKLKEKLKKNDFDKKKLKKEIDKIKELSKEQT